MLTKRPILFLIIFLSVRLVVYAQEEKKTEYVYSKPIQIALVPKSFVTERYAENIEADCNASPLFAPKGEYEKTEKYNLRKADQKFFRENLINKYHFNYVESLKKEFWRKERAEEIRVQNIRESLKSEILTIEGIGMYDADKEFFPVRIAGKNYELKVSLSEAKLFKDNIKDVVVKAHKQLKEDAQSWDIFNFVITHPITGSQYLLNQRKPLYLEGAPKKKINKNQVKLKLKYLNSENEDSENEQNEDEDGGIEINESE